MKLKKFVLTSLLLTFLSAVIFSFFKKEVNSKILNQSIKQNLLVGKNLPKKVVVKKYVAKITGFTLSPNETDNRPWEGAKSRDLRIDLARGNNVIASFDEPIGTKIKIGDKIYTVLDRMSWKHKNTGNLDILFHTKREAFRFGIQYKEVEVYYEDTLK